MNYIKEIFLYFFLCVSFGQSFPKQDEIVETSEIRKLDNHLEALSDYMRELIGVIKDIKVNLGRNNFPILNQTLETEQKISYENLLQVFKQQHTSRIIECKDPFEQVGESCMYADKSRMTSWEKARIHCNSMFSELAKFTDANMYESTIKYLRKNSINQDIGGRGVWIGGNDIEEEDLWRWNDGTLMPRDAPYWGTCDSYRKEPYGGTNENCAFLYFRDIYYVHDGVCDHKDWLSIPLCQYFPV